ncbi:hypothetical protein [Flavobacterium sp. HSC-61S13]|uniref:hypothetical protein n=1 Tax=Flavobacterium sp. HSC-61S13 TaxID=2910963 RepID=UPI0020A02DD0|nr:mannitol/fructose-specific phosphotransferase system IIA component [Flavobacterium sp. HSC-61S13]
MENSHAQKLIKKVQSDLIANGLVVEDFVTDLKKLREFALLEENPILVKAIRLTYEHVLANGAFLIDIPSDEPIDEENPIEAEQVPVTENNMESLQYILSLFTDLNNKHNIADLKEYNLKLQEA